MKIALEFPVGLENLKFSFDLPKSFFIDVAEAEQQYKVEMVEVAQAPLEPTGDAKLVASVLHDVTKVYAPLQLSSSHFFDIEAPVFKVDYAENSVELRLRVKDYDALKTYYDMAVENTASPNMESSTMMQLVLPIHSRYDELDVNGTFSLYNFITGEPSYVHRCLPMVKLSGTMQVSCGGQKVSHRIVAASFADRPQYQPCLDLPVGVLADLPFLYYSLMIFLSLGAIIVIAAIR